MKSTYHLSFYIFGSIFGAIALLPMTSFAKGNEGPSPGPHAPNSAPSVLLEKRETNGPGMVIDDILVSTDGSVVQVADGAQQVIKTLSEAEIAKIEDSIDAIQQATLVRTDPNQDYNPGGFVAKYFMSAPGANAFLFAEYVSGVDFGLPNSQGENLRALLDGFDHP